MDVRVSGFTWDDRQGRSVPYGFIGEDLGTDERTGRRLVLHPVHGRQVVRDDETVEDLDEVTDLHLPGGECCEEETVDEHAAHLDDERFGPQDADLEWQDTSTDLLTGQITVAIPGEQMELR